MLPNLAKISPDSGHVFFEPAKRICTGADIDTFLYSRAYADIMTFMQQLNRSMVPCKIKTEAGATRTQSWELTSKVIILSEPVQKLRGLLDELEAVIQQAPPSTGPRRFGNVAFRDWHARVEEKLPDLFSSSLLNRLDPAFLEKKGDDHANAETELRKYLMGSFGSAQRLDYGTGHELSFLAFLATLWKLNYFEEQEYGVEERGIVVGIFEPYLKLMRRLIKTYTLEPAGSHGVWGLDDHFFLPYIFGSAQLCPAVTAEQLTPVEGSLLRAPKPSSVTNQDSVEMWKDMNMYFSAISFIYEVKKGPFWEHSPTLYDVSGIKDGWGKINKGMIKMHNAEVLSKFPVVQHFPFGSVLQWDKHSSTPTPTTDMHTPRAQHPGSFQAPAPVPHPATTLAPGPDIIPRPITVIHRGAQTPKPVRSATGLPMTAAPWVTQSQNAHLQSLARDNPRPVHPPAPGASVRVDSTASDINRWNLEKKDEEGQSKP